MKITFEMKTQAVVLVMMASVGLYMWVDSQRTVEEAPPPPQTDFSTLTMAQAVAHCHALWLAHHWDQAPLALAWNVNGVDWYVLDGVDTQSMRHFSCTGRGLEGGERYERVMLERVPAPAGERRSVMNDRNLFLHYAAQPGTFGPALEAAQDPQDPVHGDVIERRWLNSGSPQLEGLAATLPLLFKTPPPDLATQGLTTLRALKATDWIQQPEAVFSLLADELQPGVRIAAIDVRPYTVKVSIVGPVKNFEGRPPAPYGDATFDAYGVRDGEDWYPRDSAIDACITGYTLPEVKALYANAVNRDNPRRWNAAFGCRPTLMGDDKAEWTVRVPRSKR